MPDPVDLTALRPEQATGLSDETLEEINRLWTIVRAFSATAHDVNNALQVIAGSAELLEARELDSAVRRRVEIIRQESGKAADTINRLLDFARARRQACERLDVWPPIEAAVGMRLASAGRSRIALSMRRDAIQPAWIVAERDRLLQMLLDVLLVSEERVAGRARARIDVSVTDLAGRVTVRIVAASDGDDTVAGDGASGSAPAGLTAGAELWTAAYLAALNGGVLTDGGGELAIVWPVAR